MPKLNLYYFKYKRQPRGHTSALLYPEDNPYACLYILESIEILKSVTFLWYYNMIIQKKNEKQKQTCVQQNTHYKLNIFIYSLINFIF